MAERPEQQSGEEMVTIERFRDMLQAEMAKGRLDSAGIRCFLADAAVEFPWVDIAGHAACRLPCLSVSADGGS